MLDVLKTCQGKNCLNARFNKGDLSQDKTTKKVHCDVEMDVMDVKGMSKLSLTKDLETAEYCEKKKKEKE